MCHIEVIMSTFNGKQNVVRQLDSILAQKGVDVSVLIRDDGSTDGTLELLKQYCAAHNNVRVIPGKNVGWRKSFLCGLELSEKADYYAYSDQDDVWLPNKLEECVDILESEKSNEPSMVHCNRYSCDEELKPFEVQSIKIPKPVSKKNALTQEYAQGCTIVMNKAAKDLVTKYKPSELAPHDFWTGLLCYYFGKVYYTDSRLIYHIRYKNSESDAGNIRAGQKSRMKNLFKKRDMYYNPAKDMLEGYSDLLTEKDKIFLSRVAGAKNSLRNRLLILFDPQFRRISLKGTIMLKLSIALGKF
nr:glycosyltransferase [uncultured Blautia sp.]